MNTASKIQPSRDLAAEKKLPGRVYDLCAGANIHKKDILYWAGCDETADFHFTEGYIILTSKQLAVILYPPLHDQVYSFGGYRREALNQQMDATVQVYGLDQMTGVKIQQEIGRICLVVKKKDGDIRAAFPAIPSLASGCRWKNRWKSF